jgi:hypothetical protein
VRAETARRRGGKPPRGLAELALREAGEARPDFAAIEDSLEFFMAQLAKVPTRREFAWIAAGSFATGAALAASAIVTREGGDGSPARGNAAPRAGEGDAQKIHGDGVIKIQGEIRNIALVRWFSIASKSLASFGRPVTNGNVTCWSAVARSFVGAIPLLITCCRRTGRTRTAG